jgi:PAS domain S-box-containing protein
MRKRNEGDLASLKRHGFRPARLFTAVAVALHRQGPWLGYGIGVAGVALAAWLRWILVARLGQDFPPYLTFYPVIIVAALLGGTGAGLLATAASAALVDYFFLLPVGFGIESPADKAGFAIFLATNLMMSLIGGALRSAHRRTEAQADELAQTVEVLDWANVLVRDMHDRITLWSNGCQRLYRFSSEEALGKVSHELLRTAFPEPLENIRRTLLMSGRWKGDVTHTASDGRPVIVSSEWLLRRDPAGRPSSIIELNADVTARKAAEAARDRMAAIVADSGDAVIAKDLQGQITSWNQGAERLFGYSPVQVLGQNIRLLVPPERQGEEEQIMAAIRRGEKVEHYDSQRQTRDGRLIDVSITASPIHDSSGQIVGVSKIARDITERKQAERVLARGREELEQLVAERTAKLQEMVAELEHFSYTITHDMRAPLRAMRGLAGVLVEECGACLHGERLEFLRRIADSADRLDQLIADSLQYSLLVRGRFGLEPVDADALLRGILKSYPQFQPPHAHIHVVNRLPVVLANKAGLTQCFSNLLGNAVKFVQPGRTPEVSIWAGEAGPPAAEPTLTRSPAQTKAASSPLSTWHLPEPAPAASPDGQPPAPAVRIWFEDKGIGIDKEYHDKIWLMFQRLNKSYSGTGIGLALVRKAVERMGGRVGLESKPGHGSRFWVELQSAQLDPGKNHSQQAVLNE